MMSSGEEPDTDNVVVIKNLSKVHVHIHVHGYSRFKVLNCLLVKADGHLSAIPT